MAALRLQRDHLLHLRLYQAREGVVGPVGDRFDHTRARILDPPLHIDLRGAGLMQRLGDGLGGGLVPPGIMRRLRDLVGIGDSGIEAQRRFHAAQRRWNPDAIGHRQAAGRGREGRDHAF